jgi:hypothetical protein
MKKSLILFSALLALSLPLFPSAQIDWLGSVKTSDGSTDAPTSYWAQLIWSPDNSISILDINAPLSPTGGEIVLNGTGENLVAPGFIFGSPNYADGAFGTTIPTGFVYTRIFDSSTPTIGSKFGESSLISPVQSFIPTNPASTTDQNFGTIIVSNEVIPEPTTIAILLMGILGLVGFRKHLRKD